MSENGLAEDYHTFGQLGEEDMMVHVYDFSQPDSLSDELGIYPSLYEPEDAFSHKPKLPGLTIPQNTVGLGFSSPSSASSPSGTYQDYGLQPNGHGSPMPFLMPPGGTPSSLTWRDMPLTPGSGMLLRHPLPMSTASSPFFGSGSPLGLSPDLGALTLTESPSDRFAQPADGQSISEQEQIPEQASLLQPHAQIQHPGQTPQTPDLDDFLNLYSFPTPEVVGSTGQSYEAGAPADFTSTSSRLEINIPITITGASQSLPLRIQGPGQYSPSLHRSDGDYTNASTTQPSFSFMASPSVQPNDISDTDIHANSTPSGSSNLSVGDTLSPGVKGVVHDLSLKKSKNPVYGGIKKLHGASRKMLSAVEGKRKKEQKFVCEICGQKVTSKQNLDNHVNSHMGTKPFSCTFCPKLYGHARSLNRHLLKDHDYSAREAKRRRL